MDEASLLAECDEVPTAAEHDEIRHARKQRRNPWPTKRFRLARYMAKRWPVKSAHTDGEDTSAVVGEAKDE